VFRIYTMRVDAKASL